MMNTKAQSTVEFSVLIIMVTAALLAIEVYLKTKIQGNWRGNADSFCDELYAPGQSAETVSNITFISPKIKADLGCNDSVDAQYDTASETGVIEITNWGTYH